MTKRGGSSGVSSAAATTATTATATQSVNNITTNSAMSIKDAIHLTSQQNIQSILTNGFDLSRAGEEGGDVWGDAVYFLMDKKEQDFYQQKLGSSVGISADIDTSNMLQVRFEGKVYSPVAMYDQAAEFLTDAQKQEYIDARKTTTQRRAFAKVASKYYTGVVIKQTGVDGVEGTTGGSQIVVYDTSAISNIRRYV